MIPFLTDGKYSSFKNTTNDDPLQANTAVIAEALLTLLRAPHLSKLDA